MQNLLQDLRYALRRLSKSPGFALTAVVTLTIAIGANIVVFGVLNALVLHPLPVPEANRLYTVQTPNSFAVSYPNYRDIRDRNHTFSGGCRCAPHAGRSRSERQCRSGLGV